MNEAIVGMSACTESCSPMHAGYDKIGQVARSVCGIFGSLGIVTTVCTLAGDKALGCIKPETAKMLYAAGLGCTAVGLLPPIYDTYPQWSHRLAGDCISAVDGLFSSSMVTK